MSLNSSLYTSLSGITASQTALSVSSNNMVNVSTEGYTRQQVINSSIYTPQTHTTMAVGGGVQIQEIRSISDQFLRANLRESTTELGYWSSQQSYLTQVESAYGDLYGSNIQTVTDEFLNTWEELSKNPSDLAARATVYETGVALSDMIVSYNEQLKAIEHSAVTELEDTVERINSITGELASINKQVTSYSEGDVPLELIDYRENLMDELSSYVECTFSYQSDGSVDVISSNGSLVYGQTSNELETISTPPSGLPEIRWAGGSLYNSNSGTLSALVDLVDPGKSPSFNELYDLLNDGMMQLVNEVNTIHESGIGLDGETGISFFVPMNDEEPLSIGNIMVNPVLEDVNKIAASTTGELGDGSKATEIADLQLSALIEFEGSDYTIDQYLASYTQWLGAQTQNATIQYDHQSELNTQMVTQLDSISSVSVDEEMANMVKFQQMYNANVAVMNTIDELLEGLIQKLG